MEYISRINEITLEIMEIEKEIDMIDERFKHIYCNYGVKDEIKRLRDRRRELTYHRSEKIEERSELREKYRKHSRKEYFRPLDDVDLFLCISNNGYITGTKF